MKQERPKKRRACPIVTNFTQIGRPRIPPLRQSGKVGVIGHLLRQWEAFLPSETIASIDGIHTIWYGTETSSRPRDRIAGVEPCTLR
jgi:hypothetical protein